MGRKSIKGKKIVIIGGGTGTFVALSGLKFYPVSLSSIITMMDSGGSTGRLRDQLGVLPPGDIRLSLVALSQSDKIWRDLFVYRFDNGELAGHNFGNLFLSALEKLTGSLKQGIDLASNILQVKGKAIPVTFERTDLCVELEGGRIIKGETYIDEPKEKKRAKIVRAFLKPEAKANKEAIKTIKKASLIVIGPGDLYTSIIPNLLVKGISLAIKNASAKKVFVLNLMTKFGQTTNYPASEHLADLEKYLGKNVLDVVLVNTKKPSKRVLNWYKKYNEFPVVDDLGEKPSLKIIRKDLIAKMAISKDPADRLKRSFIRHDPAKLAKTLISLL